VQVQLTCYELDGMHYDSGRKLMDAAYLEESLELQDIWDVIVISQGILNKASGGTQIFLAKGFSSNAHSLLSRGYQISNHVFTKFQRGCIS
jgi:hypothetical protein